MSDRENDNIINLNDFNRPTRRKYEKHTKENPEFISSFRDLNSTNIQRLREESIITRPAQVREYKDQIHLGTNSRFNQKIKEWENPNVDINRNRNSNLNYKRPAGKKTINSFGEVVTINLNEEESLKENINYTKERIENLQKNKFNKPKKKRKIKFGRVLGALAAVGTMYLGANHAIVHNNAVPFSKNNENMKMLAQDTKTIENGDQKTDISDYMSLKILERVIEEDSYLNADNLKELAIALPIYLEEKGKSDFDHINDMISLKSDLSEKRLAKAIEIINKNKDSIFNILNSTLSKKLNENPKEFKSLKYESLSNVDPEGASHPTSRIKVENTNEILYENKNDDVFSNKKQINGLFKDILDSREKALLASQYPINDAKEEAENLVNALMLNKKLEESNIVKDKNGNLTTSDINLNKKVGYKNLTDEEKYLLIQKYNNIKNKFLEDKEYEAKYNELKNNSEKNRATIEDKDYKEELIKNKKDSFSDLER